MPSTNPIAFGLMVLLVGLWMLSAAINNPRWRQNLAVLNADLAASGYDAG